LGNRLNHLIKRLNVENEYQTSLKSFLLHNLKLDKKSYGEGYMRGNKNLNDSEIITSYKNLIAKNFNYEDSSLTEIDRESKFQWPRNEKYLYKTPLIAIKEEITKGNIPITFFDEENSQYIPFDSRILGISFSGVANSKAFFSILKKTEKINALKTLATCSQFFLGSSSVIQKADIDNWIVPLTEDEIKLSDDEEVVLNDVLNYIYPSWYEGENALINKHNASMIQLKEFGIIFNNSFNSIYKKGNKEQRLRKITEGNDFYALEFYYGEEDQDVTKIVTKEEEINTLLRNQISKNAVINRVIKIYEENKITFLKPKNLRYWLKSTALRDADDVFDDIIENGLK